MREEAVITPAARLTIRVSEGAGLPVVLLSGGPGMPDYLQPVARLLPGRFTVTYDQRGTGASTALDGRYDVDAHVADLEAIRIHLGVQQIHLFGHSWGGMLAQLYATAHIDRIASLFLCSPSTGVGSQWVSMEREVMQYSRRRSSLWRFGLLGLWSLLARLPGTVGQRALQRMYGQVWLNYQNPAHATPADPALLAGVGTAATFGTRASLTTLPEDTLNRVLPQSDIPMYVLFGEDDIYGATIGWVKARYPRATVEVLPGAGHLAWLDRPGEFRARMERFYTKVGE